MSITSPIDILFIHKARIQNNITINTCCSILTADVIFVNNRKNLNANACKEIVEEILIIYLTSFFILLFLINRPCSFSSLSPMLLPSQLMNQSLEIQPITSTQQTTKKFWRNCCWRNFSSRKSCSLVKFLIRKC